MVALNTSKKLSLCKTPSNTHSDRTTYHETVQDPDDEAKLRGRR